MTAMRMPDGPENIEVRQPNYSVELTKNTRGYQWVIKVRGDVMLDVKDDLADLDAWLAKTYGNKTEGQD